MHVFSELIPDGVTVSSRWAWALILSIAAALEAPAARDHRGWFGRCCGRPRVIRDVALTHALDFTSACSNSPLSPKRFLLFS
eukprot:2177472-Pleurochrysis_carterae.AAC.2